MKNKEGIPARSLEFDILKGLAIYLVLCGHSVINLSSAEKQDNILYVLIYAFHMPLFMLISGYFSASTLTAPLRNIIKKKFWQLIYPTLTFGIIFFICDLILWGKSPREFFGYIWGSFWFLKSCFLCFLIFGICLKICKNNILWACILGLVISQFLPFFKLTYMLPFFIIGFLINHNKKIIYSKPGILFSFSLMVFTVIFICYLNYGLNDFPLMQVKASILKNNYLVLKDFALYQSFRFLLGLSGAIAVIAGVIVMVKHGYLKNFFYIFHQYGSETLLIYIIQTLLLEDILANLIDLHKIDKYIFSFAIVPLISFAVMDACLHITRWLNKGKYGKLMTSGLNPLEKKA